MSQPIPFLSPRLVGDRFQGGAIPLEVRLNEFRSLKPGWLDGDGVPPSPRGLDWLSQQFKTRYPGNLPPPHLYPTLEGGVRAEWSLSGYDISLDVSLESRRAQWHALELATDEEQFQEIDLGDRVGWAEIASRVASYATHC
jgi:hypothetical protein